MSGPRRLAVPRRVVVSAGEDGSPEIVDGREVDAVRESWLVEDRWWTDRPLRRHYWELVTKCQSCLCSVARERWQRLGPVKLLVDTLR